MDKKDYFLIKTQEASPTSVDKLFDAAPVVDEVCALLDRVLAARVCPPVTGRVPTGPAHSPLQGVPLWPPHTKHLSPPAVWTVNRNNQQQRIMLDSLQ